MKKMFNIIVEGEADVKFFKDYCYHLFEEHIPDERVMRTGDNDGSGGWNKLADEATRARLESMTDNGGINLVIFDADTDAKKRRGEILKCKKENGLEFELFLLPDNQSSGALEDLLENIINPNNQPIFDCWENYEEELRHVTIPGRDEPLTTPAKKSKIYCYLETLHGTSKSQKKKIKDPNRDFLKKEHWDLDAEYIKPLKEFLEKNLKDNECNKKRI